MQAPVVISGANIVGFTCALLLSEKKVPVRLIDPAPHRDLHNQSVLIYPSTLQLFEKLHLTDKIVEHSEHLESFKLYSKKEEPLELYFSHLLTNYPFICALTKKSLEDFLIDALNEKEIKIERGVEIKKIKQEADYITVSLLHDQKHKEEATVSYLISCENDPATTRPLAHIEKEYFGWTHNYLMADVLLNWNEPSKTMVGFQHPKGYVGILPIKSNTFRILCDFKSDQKSCIVSQSHLKKVLLQRVPKHLDFEDIEWISELKFRYCQAKEYRCDRIFLAGNQAHQITPFADQGLNEGIQDVFNLAWKLTYVYQKKSRAVLLASYSRERKPAIVRMLKNVRLILELASEESLFKRQLRDFLFFLFNCSKTLKKRATLQLAGLKAHLGKSPILYQQSFLRWRSGLKVGEKIQDAWLNHCSHQEKKRLFEITQDYTHHLLIYFRPKYSKKSMAFKKEVQRLLKEDCQVHLITSEEMAPQKNLWVDQEKTFYKHFHLGGCFFVMVRPDQYIGALSTLMKIEVIEDYFSQLLAYELEKS